MRSSSRHGSTKRALIVKSALTAALVFGVAPVAVRAQQPAVPAPSVPAEVGTPVTLDMRDARLEQAVIALTKSSGLQNIVLVNEAGKSFGLVNVTLTDQPLRVVLKSVADSAGALLTFEDGIYYLRHRPEGNPAVKPAEPQQKAPVAENAVTVPAAPVRTAAQRRNLQMVRVPLNFLRPSDFVKMLDDPTYLALVQGANGADNDVAQPFQDKQNTSSILLQPGSATSEVLPKGSSINNGAVTTGATGSAAGNAGEGLGAANQRGFGGGGFGGGGGQFGGGGGGIGGFGGGGQGGLPGGGGGQAGPGGQNGQNSLRGLFPDVTNIVSNDATNDLLVLSDSIEDVDRLRQLIKLLDVAPKQVIIKAEFVSVSISDADSFGIDWRIQPAGNLDVQIPPEAGGVSPTITLAYAAGNAVANFRASVIRDTSNLIQAPIISTTNNRPGSIQFNRTITVQQTVNIASGNGTVLSNTVQIPITAQNGLSVTPHINGDNSITMFLTPQLTDIQRDASGGFNATTQQVVSTRRIQNGETMVIGGFISKTTTAHLRQVPFLADLPIIGNLFKQRDRTTTGTEVLVFITPTIIEDRAQGVIGTGGGQAAPTP